MHELSDSFSRNETTRRLWSGAVGLIVRWLLLIALSIVFTSALKYTHISAALMLGPMAAALVFAAFGAKMSIPPGLFFISQGVVGCMIARTITPSLGTTIAQHWPTYLIVIFSVLAASNLMGWLLARWKILPGTTAIWGSAPGAATAMALMAEGFGEDIRLVAFMQYVRVVFVAIVASVVTRLSIGPTTAAVPATVWFGPVHWVALVETTALIVAAVIATRRLHIPAGTLLVPLVAGAFLHCAHVVQIELPPLVLAVSYGAVGISIGLRFTREIFAHVARTLPVVAASSLTLIAICGVFAYILHHVTGIDPLTAYLATSPGGADSVAIIASSSHVDVSFVMAMQTGRFLMVLLTGPAVARFLGTLHKSLDV